MENVIYIADRDTWVRLGEVVAQVLENVGGWNDLQVHISQGWNLGPCPLHLTPEDASNRVRKPPFPVKGGQDEKAPETGRSGGPPPA